MLPYDEEMSDKFEDGANWAVLSNTQIAQPGKDLYNQQYVLNFKLLENEISVVR